MRLIDVKHLDRERVIGCWEVDGVLIDPGPASSIDNVIEAIGDKQPRALLLTHIHLDHAGATGTLVKRWPELPVYVSEHGAPHLADPSKLLRSARRLYAEHMDRLWGEVLPVPVENITALAGGEEVVGFEVAYTPGHASHHLSYFHPDSGRAFVGDMAAVRIPPSNFVIPPTPPPDIDVETWEHSIDKILDWAPDSLGLTHFGEVSDPYPHMQIVRQRLHEQAEQAETGDAEEFERRLREDIERFSPDMETAEALLQAVPPEQQFYGLDRYWSKKAEREAKNR